MRDNTNHFLGRKQNGGKGNRNMFSFEKAYYVAYTFFN